MPVVGLAKRWTFYVGKDGKILAIDKDVKVDTAGADIAARLAELGVARYAEIQGVLCTPWCIRTSRPSPSPRRTRP